MRYLFANCEVDTELYTLQRQGRLLHVRPKVFQALVYLLENRHRVIPKEELSQVIWPAQFVGDANVERTISEVRQVVGDKGSKRHIVQTFHSHGYRLIASVEELQEKNSSCLNRVEEKTLPPPQPLPSATLCCPTCQKLSPESAAFCMFCGAPLQQSTWTEVLVYFA